MKEEERKAFEADAEALGYDLTRGKCQCGNLSCEYEAIDTGQRWAGWMAKADNFSLD